MATETDSDQSSTLTVETQTARWIALAAILAAATPHLFLNHPVDFYQQMNTSAWLGLTVWAPTFLAAVATFVGVSPTARTNSPLLDSPDLRMVAGLSVPIVVLVVLAKINFSGHQYVESWGSLGLAMAIYAATFALGTFFWQGLVQKVVLEPLAPLIRPVLVAAAGALIWLPFLATYSWADISELVGEHALIYLALAVLFELGVSVLGCMGAAVLMGAAWGWVHQMVFF